MLFVIQAVQAKNKNKNWADKLLLFSQKLWIYFVKFGRSTAACCDVMAMLILPWFSVIVVLQQKVILSKLQR